MITYKGKYTTADVMVNSIEPSAAEQIVAFVNDPSFTNPVKIMPDVHYGKGAVIGFTMPFGNNIIPFVVGVDIACGVRTLLFKCDRSFIESFRNDSFNKKVRSTIMFGNGVYSKPKVNIEREFPWEVINKHGARLTTALNYTMKEAYKPPTFNFSYFNEMCKRIGENPWYAQCSCGSLGGGNHYGEVGYCDEEGLGYISIHSGSRHLGLKTATYWQDIAVQRAAERSGSSYSAKVESIKNTYPKVEWQTRITALKAKLGITSGMEYLTGADLFGYMWDSLLCQYFALESRRWMADAMVALMQPPTLEDVIDTTHNYINMDDLIIRKGAVSARKDELLVIPLSMEDGILVCRGKGNPEWNFSAPHGAGRLFSRNEAKRSLNEGAITQRMRDKGIYSSVTPKDELSDAYKPAEEIIDAIGPTVEILYRLLPLVNFKSK